MWLDDFRPMPKGFDIWCKDSFSAIHNIINGKITYISFDHDLGPEPSNTGYKVASYIEYLASLGALNRLEWDIHSANPVGRERIEMAMRSAERYWDRR